MSPLLFLMMLGVPSWTDSVISNRNDVPECGPSCAYDLLKSYGRNVTLEDLTARFKRINPEIDFKRVSFLELDRVLSSYGLHCLALKFNLSDLAVKDIPTPAILHLNLPSRSGDANEVGHYVVLHSIDNSSVTVYDPAPSLGLRTADLGALKTVWSGRLLYVSPEPIDTPTSGVRLVLLTFLAVQLLVLAGFGGRRWLLPRSEAS